MAAVWGNKIFYIYPLPTKWFHNLCSKYDREGGLDNQVYEV